jgi:very-short-patch-repair endonuclease
MNLVPSPSHPPAAGGPLPLPQAGEGKVQRARRLRREATIFERRLWAALRGRKMGGFKFKRQYPVAGYFVDFVCLERGLVVELDGAQHADRVAYDMQRTRALGRAGLRVVRFWNNDVVDDIDGVLAAIVAALDSPLPPAGEEGARARSAWEGEGL